MISFPGLGLHFTINKIAFTVGGKDIYWYGIILSFAVLTAVVYAVIEVCRQKMNLDSALDAIIFGIIFGVIGARLYFVLFNIHNYESFGDIFKIWEGGIAIYGGIIGGVTAGFVVCKRKGLDAWQALDIGAIALLIGQAIGRFGNFVNREAYGSETMLPWRMQIVDNLGRVITVHPTFLYEFLWNLCGIIFLSVYKGRKKFQGEIFWMYVFWYGLGRLWIEQLRVDSLPYGAPFKISQIVAVISIIISTYFIVKWRKSSKRLKNE